MDGVHKLLPLLSPHTNDHAYLENILQSASQATNGSMTNSQPPLVYPPSQDRPISRWQPLPITQDIQIFSAIHDFNIPQKSIYTDGSFKDIGGCSSVAIHPNGNVYACRPFGPPSPYRGEVFAIWLATMFATPQQKIFSDCKGAIKAIMGTKSFHTGTRGTARSIRGKAPSSQTPTTPGYGPQDPQQRVKSTPKSRPQHP